MDPLSAVSLAGTIVQFVTFVSGMVMLVMFYFVAIFMTLIAGYPPSKAGVQLVYFAPGVGGGTILAINIIKHTRQVGWFVLISHPQY